MSGTIGGPAQLVVTSTEAPDAGPARPVAVVSSPIYTLAGPPLKIVEVSDNRPRIGGPALPVAVASGAQAGAPQAGPPIPVYVVSGSLNPNTNPLDDVPLRDAFNRADGPLGANWTQDSIAVPGGPIAQIISQQAAPADAVNYAQQYWNVATFGPDMATIFLISALPGVDNTYAEIDIVTRRQNDGSRYELQVWWNRYAPADNTARFAWFDAANTQSVIGGSITAVDIAEGDLVASQVVGTALTMWRKRAGTWTQLITVADAHIAGAGRAGMALYDDSGTFRVDTFSAGTL